MITRIEIDGFKSFENFALDLPPFLVLIGTNASGKSNLLDAVTFVATTATRGVDAAVAEVRGDPRGLFRRRGDGNRVDRMRFALEILLPGRLSHLCRYELDLVWAEPVGAIEGIVAERQRIVRLGPESSLRWASAVGVAAEGLRPWPVPLKAGHVIDLTGMPPVIGSGATKPEQARAELENLANTLLHSPSRPGTDVERADETILAGVWQELNLVRFLHLEAGALRRTSELGGPSRMDATGRDLPNYLRSLMLRTASDNRPLGVVGDIKMHLTGLVREISDFTVDKDDRRRDVRLEFFSPYEQRLDAEFASDGTLRMLAILASLHDDGVVAVEEPENGVFPERLRQLLNLARGLVTDLRQSVEDDGRDNTAWHRQAIFTSHSPVVLDAVPYENIAFLDMTTVIEDGVPSRVSRVRRLREDAGPVRVAGERWPRVTDSELDRFRAGVEEPV
ncbi:AAA family ATPase [Microbispora sp. H13382]|uniref:AAA family ATPase n=1 Tax=Microbispora sp. H13382 TaxID=2729112 RepID=UPI0016013865|nr:ATP-binding protein [Microbispora sp. H13382]